MNYELPKITFEGLNKQEKRYVTVRSIYRFVVMLLALMAWVLLFVFNWKIAIMIFFIIWGQNESRK